MTTCRECGADVIWKRIAGRPFCYNPDGVTSHWDTCSKLKWEAVKRTGERFENKQDDHGNTVSGYANSVHGTKLEMILSSFVTKPDKPRVPCGRDAGECKQPPWEVCAKKCPNRIERKSA